MHVSFVVQCCLSVATVVIVVSQFQLLSSVTLLPIYAITCCSTYQRNVCHSISLCTFDAPTDISMCVFTVACMQKWVRFLCDPLMAGLVTTTNGLERQHQHLKSFLCSISTGGSISDLVTTIVEQFIPSCQRQLV